MKPYYIEFICNLIKSLPRNCIYFSKYGNLFEDYVYFSGDRNASKYIFSKKILSIPGITFAKMNDYESLIEIDKRKVFAYMKHNKYF